MKSKILALDIPITACVIWLIHYIKVDVFSSVSKVIFLILPISVLLFSKYVVRKKMLPLQESTAVVLDDALSVIAASFFLGYSISVIMEIY